MAERRGSLTIAIPDVWTKAVKSLPVPGARDSVRRCSCILYQRVSTCNSSWTPVCKPFVIDRFSRCFWRWDVFDCAFNETLQLRHKHKIEVRS